MYICIYIYIFISFPQPRRQDTLGVFQDEIPQGTGSLDEGGGTRRGKASGSHRKNRGVLAWENHPKNGEFTTENR